MGQKDLAEKSLEFYPDVFADVVNALLYRRRQVLKPGSLNPAPTETLYPGQQGQLHNQFHDVSKYEMRGERIRAQYTLENETKVNRKLVLRKAGYEGAVYRGQYDGEAVYPFVSLVLYWGRRRWRAPRSLRQLFSRGESGKVSGDASEGLAGAVAEGIGDTDAAENKSVFAYMDNVRLHVYEMAHLPKAVRERFRSDMRIVVDYLAEGKDYVPTGQKIVHVEALLRMLSALAGDDRFESLIPQMLEEEKAKGGVTMCEWLDKYENRGVVKGVDRANQLIRCLLGDGRIEEIARVVSDKEYQERLFVEYGV